VRVRVRVCACVCVCVCVCVCMGTGGAAIRLFFFKKISNRSLLAIYRSLFFLFWLFIGGAAIRLFPSIASSDELVSSCGSADLAAR
jgi:hypothetical protein